MPTKRPTRTAREAAAGGRAPASKRAAPSRSRVGRPPGKTSAETRTAIMVAARECFARVGYERATNRDIAAEAGITAAAIYQYFGSKTELYVAVATVAIEELMPRLRAAVSGAPTARLALSAIVREQLSLEQHVTSARFLANVPVEMQRHPELAQAMIAQPGTFFELILDVIRLGIRGGEIDRDKGERVLGMFMAAVIGLSIHGATVGGPHSAAATQGFMDLLEGTLFK